MNGDLNLPFEPVGGNPIPIDLNGHMCGGVVVRAAVSESPLGKVPLLIFTFASADGRGFLPPIILGVDDLHGLVTLVRDAAVAAAGAAAS